LPVNSNNITPHLTLDFIRQPLSLLQRELAVGNFTCKQAVEFFLKRIEEQKHLNAFLEVFADEALEKATALDKKIKSGNAGKLHGLVVGIKDNICYKGHKASAASKILKNFTSLYNATAVERILAEDAIIIGRLNCDEFGMGSSNENSAYGAVLNYLDNTKVAGGSSGGSAAAVQAGLCHAALGSDTGGSVRMPASFCGIVGMKPTYGRISRHGLIAYASSFDQIGTLTNSVEDAALLLEVMAGADNYDSTASKNENLSFYSAIPLVSDSPLLWRGGGGEASISEKKYSIAFIKQTLEHPGLDPEIKSRTESILDRLKQEGYEIAEVELPLLEYIVPAYYIMTTAEASSNLSRYDGVRYGHRSALATDVESLYKKSRSEGFGKEVQRRIMLGTFVLSAGYQDAYYTQAQRVRRMLKEATETIFSRYDFILLPTTPCTAFTLGEKTKNPVEMYLADIYTVQANLAGIPSISLPLGKHTNGMPFGVQVMAERFEEQKMMGFARELTQGMTGW